MSGFNSNFNDIQKQISFANLTDEQIQELMSILQTKRNVKPKLTKEEKVFYQCCREHRSYSANQDTDTVFCPVCGSIKIIRTAQRTADRDINARIVQKLLGIPLVLLPFALNYLLQSGLNLSS